MSIYAPGATPRNTMALLLLTLVVCVVASPSRLYSEAIGSLQTYEPSWVDTPEKDIRLGYQDPTVSHTRNGLPPPVASSIASLKQAAAENYFDAALALADIYAFGNYSVPANYSEAAYWYEQAAGLQPSGHAHHMLGHIYSTGMFGAVPVDKPRARLHYEFAAQNGDIASMLVLAYNHLHGIGCQADCDVAQFYYSAVARHAMQLAANDKNPFDQRLVLHNVNLADFDGGLFGEKLSESENTLHTEFNDVLAARSYIREKNIDALEWEVFDLYFDALELYYGSHKNPQHRKNACRKAMKCLLSGESLQPVKGLTDYRLWIKCTNLAAHMLLRGEGCDTDYNLAYTLLSRSNKLMPDVENNLDLGVLRAMDPTSNGKLSEDSIAFLEAAVANKSTHASFLLARERIVSRDPFLTDYTQETFSLIKKAAYAGHKGALFYLADAIESGFAATVGEAHSCTDLSYYYKVFIADMEQYVLPHLPWAYEQLKAGNRQAALLGFLMAAEQGFINSQVSTLYLLYQREPLLASSSYNISPSHFESSLHYMELASAQGHVDATIMLGEYFSNGLPGYNSTVDHKKAFAYFNKAALAASPHACYRMGNMYEYGMGTENLTIDYYMAKRYYDLSIRYYENLARSSSESINTYAITLALLRIKLKSLIFPHTGKKDLPQLGWFNTLKNIAEPKEQNDWKAQAHHEGIEYEDQDDFGPFDYVVLCIALGFFVYVVIQNTRRVLRRDGQHAPEGQGDGQAANVPRFQVEFFFAL